MPRGRCVWDAKLSLSLSLTLTLSFPWKQGAHDFLRCRAGRFYFLLVQKIDLQIFLSYFTENLEKVISKNKKISHKHSNGQRQHTFDVVEATVHRGTGKRCHHVHRVTTVLLSSCNTTPSITTSSTCTCLLHQYCEQQRQQR